MILSDEDIIPVLRQFNPWWEGRPVPGLSPWKRAAYGQVEAWLKEAPGGRALMLSGPRQVGKTTIFLQAVEQLLRQGVPAANILYATFDHPLLKLCGLDRALKVWRSTLPAKAGPEYLFLDEIQSLGDWQVWVKHQVDFQKQRRLALTGSALPLARQKQESLVGRLQTLRLATLSFYEYLVLSRAQIPQGLPELTSLTELFDKPDSELKQISHVARDLSGLFHQYLLVGGFPASAQLDDIYAAQKFIREDIVDKVLKRDMTAFYKVRGILELEQLFLYLCLHDGGQLELSTVASALGAQRPTVGNYLDLLEATHLIYRLKPHGYGKTVLRGRPKIYFADPAIAPAVMAKGRSLLDDAVGLGMAVESAFFKHVFTRYYQRTVGFSYWLDNKAGEVDIVAETEGRIVPFEVKYRSSIDSKDFKSLDAFCSKKKIGLAYLITKQMEHFGVRTLNNEPGTRVLSIPAPLACYWLGKMEQRNQSGVYP